MATSADIETDLIINRLTRSIYNELSASGKIYNDQLYLIDDENFDVFSKRVTNVKDPEESGDAVNLNYLSDYYIQKDQVADYIDNSRIYSENLASGWANGSTYIQGNRDVYTKDTNKWNVTVIRGSVTNVTVEYNTGFGWQFCINGTYRFGQNFTPYPDTMRETTTYSGETVEVSATSWSKTDTLVGKKDVYSCLSSITATSGVEDIASALVKLKEKMS